METDTDLVLDEYIEVNELLDTLIASEKTMPNVVNTYFKKIVNDKQKTLERIQFNLTQTQLRVINNDILDMGIQKPNKIDEAITEKLYQQTKLLHILCKKKTCPISKIINEI